MDAQTNAANSIYSRMEFATLLARIVMLEQQVANQASLMSQIKLRDAQTLAVHEMKSQAAQQQATEHLYAPLRSDTKPLLEMAAFVRKVASKTGYFDLTVRELAVEAQEILKRST